MRLRFAGLYQVVSLLARLYSHQTIKAASTTMSVPTRIGRTIARMDRTVEMISSAMDTGIFPAPPVVAVTIGRTAPALATCTVPATSNPHASASTGLTSVTTLALAAKATAPAAGRISV